MTAQKDVMTNDGNKRDQSHSHVISTVLQLILLLLNCRRDDDYLIVKIDA